MLPLRAGPSEGAARFAIERPWASWSARADPEGVEAGNGAADGASWERAQSENLLSQALGPNAGRLNEQAAAVSLLSFAQAKVNENEQLRSELAEQSLRHQGGLDGGPGDIREKQRGDFLQRVQTRHRRFAVPGVTDVHALHHASAQIAAAPRPAQAEDPRCRTRCNTEARVAVRFAPPPCQSDKCSDRLLKGSPR